MKTLEEQAALPIVNPVEMGQPSLDAAVARVAAIPEYQDAFRKVFGAPPNARDLLRAIASYERTQLSFDSPFDRFIAGDSGSSRLGRLADFPDLDVFRLTAAGGHRFAGDFGIPVSSSRNS